MKTQYTSPFAGSLSQDLLVSLLLLSLSAGGGWLAFRGLDAAAGGSVHARLLIVLLVHPFALAALAFCGLPGLGLALKSLFSAAGQRKPAAFAVSAGLLALSLACASRWV